MIFCSPAGVTATARAVKSDAVISSSAHHAGLTCVEMSSSHAQTRFTQQDAQHQRRGATDWKRAGCLHVHVSHSVSCESINVALGFACYQQQDVDAPSVRDETVMGASSSADKCRLSTSKSRQVIQLQQLNTRQTESVSPLFTQLTPKPLKRD